MALLLLLLRTHVERLDQIFEGARVAKSARDLAAGRYAYRKALAAGRGTALDL